MKAFFIWHSSAVPPEPVGTFGQTAGGAWGTGTDTSVARETLRACVRDGDTCCSRFCNNCRITTHQPCGLKWSYAFFFFPEEILVSWILCRRDVIITSSVNPVRIIFSFSVVSLR